jgi:D-alanyl-D-alanine carboxypeptidase
MRQKTTNPSTYKKISSNFNARIAENEKKDRQKLIVIALATLLLASILLFTAALIETSAGKYIYVYGEYKQKIDKNQAIAGKIQMIDLNALADYCNIEKEPSGAKVTYKINGTMATFENEKNTANINGIDIQMPAKASVKNGYCLIPLTTAKELFLGINFESSQKTVSVSLGGNKIFIIAQNPKVEYASDISAYLSAITSNDPYISILVNKENPVDESFPEDKDSLIEIPAQLRKEQVIYLYKVALQALEAMMNDMIALGYNDVYVTSAYRNHNYQTMLFEMYIENEMNKGYSYDEALALANKYSARPEHSEHRTGLAVDFTTKSIYGVVDDVFETTTVSDWLKENAWKYGFILRYPKDKIDITGYQHESWHYRFVGLEVASIIYQTGICYEEYLEYFGN